VPLFYLDSSALVKLVRREPESEELRRFLADADLVSSELVLTEVPRAIRRAAGLNPQLPAERLMAQAESLLDALGLLPLDRALLAAAGAFDEATLRALDAIHLASAVDIAPIDAFVSYDGRQRSAAGLAGLLTVAPGG
jgi:uncharacterized protein